MAFRQGIVLLLFCFNIMTLILGLIGGNDSCACLEIKAATLSLCRRVALYSPLVTSAARISHLLTMASQETSIICVQSVTTTLMKVSRSMPSVIDHCCKQSINTRNSLLRSIWAMNENRSSMISPNWMKTTCLLETHFNYSIYGTVSNILTTVDVLI